MDKFKLLNSIFLLFTFFYYPLKVESHSKGYFKSELEAKKKALKLGCDGAFKLKELWLPCKNEVELHKYLRKN